MKIFKKLLLIAALMPVLCGMHAQVEIDQPLQMTGGAGFSSITGLVDPPVNATDAVNKAYVDAAVSAGGGGIPWTKSQTFNTNGTFTVPSGVSLIKVLVYGAGGGGGTGYSSTSGWYGGGGGGGGYAENIFEVGEGDNYSVTVGTGGAGGTGAGNNPGSDGGSSIFTGPDATISATGGSGGDCGNCSTNGTGGMGGVGSGGSINSTLGSGGNGGFSNTIAGQPGTNGGGSGGAYRGGGGGGGIGGGNGGNNSPGKSAIANTGAGGGGGGFSQAAGGAGANGKVVVYW